MKLGHKAIVISALLGLSIMVVGCSKSDPEVVTVPTTPGGGPSSNNGAMKGSPTSNTAPMPAPPGVKIGLEGGRKD